MRCINCPFSGNTRVESSPFVPRTIEIFFSPCKRKWFPLKTPGLPYFPHPRLAYVFKKKSERVKKVRCRETDTTSQGAAKHFMRIDNLSIETRRTSTAGPNTKNLSTHKKLLSQKHLTFNLAGDETCVNRNFGTIRRLYTPFPFSSRPSHDPKRLLNASLYIIVSTWKFNNYFSSCKYYIRHHRNPFCVFFKLFTNISNIFRIQFFPGK